MGFRVFQFNKSLITSVIKEKEKKAKTAIINTKAMLHEGQIVIWRAIQFTEILTYNILHINNQSEVKLF
jgi:hypothetical protein